MLRLCGENFAALLAARMMNRNTALCTFEEHHAPGHERNQAQHCDHREAADRAFADELRRRAQRGREAGDDTGKDDHRNTRSEEHKSELQSLMRTSYAVFCLKQKKPITHNT